VQRSLRRKVPEDLVVFFGKQKQLGRPESRAAQDSKQVFTMESQICSCDFLKLVEERMFELLFFRNMIFNLCFAEMPCFRT